MRVLSKLIVALVYLAIPVAVALSIYGALNYYIKDPRDPKSAVSVVFDTERAKNFKQICELLERDGLVRSSFAFRLLARVEKKDTQIKAGEYDLRPSMTPQEILDKMVRGDTIPRRATVREGMTLVDIARVFEEAGIVDRGSFNKALADTDLLKEEGVQANSFEGYLFPETYNFKRNTQARTVIKAMHEQLKKRWLSEWDSRVVELGMSQHSILTLASIIEKESGNFDEQPIVSSVFHNRLKINMRLQADPTVIYGIKDFNGNITKKDLQTETPYNTYVISGLPPGPIANPGITAIKAALYPAETKYFYFVGNGDGRHVFSETLDRHVEAVNMFQR
jgi:UPF0755 protein